MNKHRGQIVEKTIKDLGLKIKEVARQMEISRGTLYNYFKQADLSDDILRKLGKTIRYDFYVQIPDLAPPKDASDHKLYSRKNTEEVIAVQKKYYILLEKHRALLNIVLGIACKERRPELEEACKLLEITDGLPAKA